MSMTPQDEQELRAKQRGRALVTGLLLGFCVILFYAITIAKMGAH